MALSFLKIKIRPKSTEVDLDVLTKEISKKVEELGGSLQESLKEEMAFGMKSLIVTISWPEEKESFALEQALEKIEDVSSFDIIDHRRAFG